MVDSVGTMREHGQTFRRTIFILAAAATCGLIYNMLGFQLFREEILFNRDTVVTAELVMMFVFLIILIFNISSVSWILQSARGRKEFPQLLDVFTLILGIFCVLLLIGVKVMTDEIARETRLGWETAGEWVILYILFLIQLGYNGMVFFLLSRSDRLSNLRSAGTAYL